MIADPIGRGMGGASRHGQRVSRNIPSAATPHARADAVGAGTGEGTDCPVPLVSLVMGTKGRTEELRRFLLSLANQTARGAELIIVDQNDDDRVQRVLHTVPLPIPVSVIRSEPGLSRARNVGLRQARGRIIGFPDDDCWYPPDLLARVLDAFSRSDADVICGRTCDGDGREERAWPRTARALNLRNVWACAISFTIFARRRVLDRVPGFDEQLGVGAGTIYGSGEETDFLIRILRAGFRIEYTPDMLVFHPVKNATYDMDTWSRTRSYAPGFGRVLRKNGYPAWFLYFALLKSAGKVVIGTVRSDPWYRRCGVEQIRGYWTGWRGK